MDGSWLTTVALGDVVQTAMRNTVPFGTLRVWVYQWMRDRGYTVLATERVNDEGPRRILVTYWDDGGATVFEAFDECPTYTKVQPVSTW